MSVDDVEKWVLLLTGIGALIALVGRSVWSLHNFANRMSAALDENTTVTKETKDKAVTVAEENKVTLQEVNDKLTGHLEQSSEHLEVMNAHITWEKRSTRDLEKRLDGFHARLEKIERWKEEHGNPPTN